MALTRKFLAALGIDADKVDEIIQAHTDTVTALKDEAAKYKADAEKLPGVQKELNDLKEAAKDSGAYDKLKKEFDDYKAAVKSKETLEAKKAALREVAKDAGLSDAGIAKAIKYSDYTFELDDKGKVKDAKDLIKSLREEWPEHIQKESEKGVETATPPKGAGGKTYSTKEEIMQIKDPQERQTAIAENSALFGF